MRTKMPLSRFFPNLYKKDTQTDMQKYVVIYRSGVEWKKTFSKTANDACKIAESKEDKKAHVSSVWACVWGEKDKAPFCLRGDPFFGREIVDSMVKEIREKQKIFSKKDEVTVRQKPKIKAKALVVKKTPRYKRPYDVLFAEEKRISA